MPLKVAQELRGSAQFWCAAQPALGPELPVLDRMLASGTAWAGPKGTPEEQDAAWDEWHHTLEYMRALFGVPELWATTFHGSFGQMLTARERLALPGQAAKTRWTGGDATKEVIGAIDWGRAEPAGDAPRDGQPA